MSIQHFLRLGIDAQAAKRGAEEWTTATSRVKLAAVSTGAAADTMSARITGSMFKVRGATATMASGLEGTTRDITGKFSTVAASTSTASTKVSASAQMMGTAMGRMAGEATRAASNMDTANQQMGSSSQTAAAKVKQAAEQQTSALSMLAGTIKMVAASWAVYKLYDFIRDSTLLAARNETLSIVLTQVGRNAGYSKREMEGYAKEVEKMGITMNESKNSVIRMAQAQLDLSKAGRLARVAQDAAVIGGINSSEAFERLVHGIQSAQVEILRTIGIQVRFEQGYEKMARTLKKKQDQLTETEKAQARMNQVLEYGARIQGTYEASMGTAGKQIQSMKRYVEDLKVKIGEVGLDTLTVAVFGLTDGFKAANKEMDAFKKSGSIGSWAESAAESLAFVADVLNNIVNLTSWATKEISRMAEFGNQAAKWGTIRALPGGQWLSDKMGYQEDQKRLDEYTAAVIAAQQKLLNEGSKFRDALKKQFADRARDRKMAESGMNMSDYAPGEAPGSVGYDPNARPGRTQEQMDKVKAFVDQMSAKIEQLTLSAEQAELKALERQAKAAGLTDTEFKKQLERLKLAQNEKKLKDEQTNSTLQRIKLEEEANERKAAQQKASDAQFISLSEQYEDYLRRLEQEVDLHGKSGLELRKITEISALNLAIEKAKVGATEEQIERLEQLRKLTLEGLEKNFKILERREGDWREGFAGGMKQIGDSVSRVAENVKTSFVSAFEKATDALTEFVMTGKLSFKQLATSIIADIVRMQMRWMMWKAMQMAMSFFMPTGGGSSGGGGGGSGAPGFGSPMIQTHQGGPVRPQQAYLVGEKGPERFVPDQPGTVIPNDQIAPKQEYKIVNQFNIDSRSDQAVIITAMERARQATLASLYDLRRRRAPGYAAA